MMVDAEWLLHCPLSFERMEDPVVLFPSGQSYDRRSICQSLLHFPNLDPKSGLYYDKPLRYTTNFALRNILQDMHALVPYDDSYFAEAYAEVWEEKVGRVKSAQRRGGVYDMIVEAPHRFCRSVVRRAFRRFGKQRVVESALLFLVSILTASIWMFVFAATAKERIAAKETLCSQYRMFFPAEAWYSC